MPKTFSKSHVPGTEMTFIAVDVPPLPNQSIFEHNCNFVNDILYPNAMFGQGGGGGKAVKKLQNR